MITHDFEKIYWNDLILCTKLKQGWTILQTAPDAAVKAAREALWSCRNDADTATVADEIDKRLKGNNG